MAEIAEPPVIPARLVRHGVSIVWLLPLIAALAAGWLGWRTLAERGPTITISFVNAQGLEAGKTRIKHNDVDLGVIESLQPTPDLDRVIATARMIKPIKPRLVGGTRFWIVRPRLSLEGVSGLDTLVSGAYVELDPGQGAAARDFIGLEQPPVVAANVPGTIYTLRATRLGSIGPRAPISCRGLEVGQVLGTEIADGDGAVLVRVFIRAPHDQLVREGTRFWNASGVTAGGDGFKLQSESLLTLLAGGIAFDVPVGAEPGSRAQPEAAFALYDDAGAAADAIYTRKARFLLHFAGPVQNLRPGAEVRMQGMRIGAVTDVHIEFDASTDRVSVPVTIEIEADRVRLLRDPGSSDEFQQRAYATFGRFVARGLRARLASGNLITGQKLITLDFVSNQPEMALDRGSTYPEIPTLASDDLDSVVASAKDLLASLRTTATSLNGLLTSREMSRSVRSLDGTLANLDRITGEVSAAGPGALVTKLRASADSGDAVLKQADATLASAGGAFAGRDNNGDLAGMIGEIKAAARSVRLLADYLETHPDSLVRGRGG